jgi:hypothetical protein
LQFASAEQPSSLQVGLDASKLDHADEIGECRSTDASGDAIGSDSRVASLKGPAASHGVAQVTNHAQAAFQGTQAWEKGAIIQLYKSGDISSLGSYRRISLVAISLIVNMMIVIIYHY